MATAISRGLGVVGELLGEPLDGGDRPSFPIESPNSYEKAQHLDPAG